MSSVVFWILAIGIWLIGVVGISAASVAIFDGPITFVASGVAGALWGYASYVIGSFAYDEFVN